MKSVIKVRDSGRKVKMQSNQFELAVAIPRDGRSVKIREYGRNGLTFVEGKKGQPYSIQFRNNSPNRVMAIISVDGVDVVDGKPATAESRGYIVEGYASAEIKGWRTSTSEIRQFCFEDKQGSYSAATTGENTNCGVIAVKVFAEKAKPLPMFTWTPPTVIREDHHHYHHDILRSTPLWGSPVYTCSAGHSGPIGATGAPGPAGAPGPNPCGEVVQSFMCSTSLGAETLKCAASAPETAPEFNLGTGWGAAMTDCVSLTSFDKAYEMASLAVYYTNADALQKMGIVLDKEVAVMSLPQGFGGFCQPPKGIR